MASLHSVADGGGLDIRNKDGKPGVGIGTEPVSVFAESFFGLTEPFAGAPALTYASPGSRRSARHSCRAELPTLHGESGATPEPQ